MEPSQEIEESRGAWRGWLIVILVAAIVAVWGLVNFVLVRDVPRSWHFGSLPSAPSESVYSTHSPPESASPPAQISPLPEAQPSPPPGRPGETP
jgi:hypothetical protein